MVRKILISSVIVLILSAIFSGAVTAKEKARILVLPFEVNSKKDLSYLSVDIPKIISEQLKKEGATLLDPSSLNLSEKKVSIGVEQAKSFGSSVNADYVVWGSFSRIGKKISLDVKLLDRLNKENPELLFSEGDGIDSLPIVLNRVTTSMGIQVFGFETIAQVVVQGNERIEADAIAQVIESKPGDRFQKSKLSKDLETVYRMGYFDDIRIESEKLTTAQGGGIKVVFTVKEKPTIKKIRIEGSYEIAVEKIEKELTMSVGSILNSNRINANIKQIESLYVEKHYNNTKVNYKTYPEDNNQVIVEFIIEEGEKVRIKEIEFVGNNSMETKDLKKIMKTEEKWFFSWLMSSDHLDMADLNTDIAMLTGEYLRKGFIDVKIAEPEIRYEEEWIFIKIKIEEGIQYKVGKIDISGDLVMSKIVLLENLRIKKEKFCNKEMIQKDIIALTDVFADKGYANADVNPRLVRDPFKKTADILFNIKKGKQVFFEHIIIGGNITTRDKVIRRQLHVYEQELYSSSKLKRSVRNLYRLDYFEDVKVNTERGSSDDKLNLRIDVEEKPTGTFTFGMGYSSQDKFFGTLAVSKRNLFGRDQTLNLESELGEKAKKYAIQFTEPWLFDIPLSMKTEMLYWERELDSFDKDTIGGGVTFGYPIYDYTRFYSGYAYEVNDVSNITSDAESIQDLEGTNITRGVTNTVRYDSRDRAHNAQPTDGANHSLSVEFTGGILGGEVSFSKYLMNLGYYRPLPYGFIAYGRGIYGFVQKNSSGILPDYEKFYLGGSNSVRGFDREDIYIEDDKGQKIGAEQKVQFNFELLRPLFGMEGLLGMVYHDLGQVYSKDESVDLNALRRSWGFGIKWFSPIGPIRCEYSYIIDPQMEEPTSGRFDFNMGGSF